MSWRQATVIVAGLWTSTLPALCFLPSDPQPSIITCYSGNFRLSFRFPCGFLPGGSCLKSVPLSILRFFGFPGYSHGLTTCDFSRLLPATCVTFHAHSKLHYLKNAQCPFSCRPSDLFAELAPRSRFCGYQPSGFTFNGTSFGLPFAVPLRFPIRDSPPRSPYGSHF